MAGWNPYASPQGPPPLPELERFYLNQDPDAAWSRYLGLLGFGGIGPRARYGQGQFNRWRNMFHADAAANPNMGFYDWLVSGNRGQRAANEFNQATPDATGDFSYRSLTPKARYVIG